MQGKYTFIELSDGTVQAGLQVFIEGTCDGLKELIDSRADKVGSSLLVVGDVVLSPGKGQAIELRASKITVLGACDPETYPLAKKAHSLEFLRENAHLRPRTRTVRFRSFPFSSLF